MEFKDQKFLNLLFDSLKLLDYGMQNPDTAFGKTCCRTSIYTSVSLLEAVANSCLASLKLDSVLEDEIDKLTVMAKFDYFLFATTGKHLDRSQHSYSLAKEVLSIRNKIAHPKRISGYLSSDQSSETMVEYGKTNVLQIPKNTDEWNGSHAVLVLEAICNYLVSYFLSQAQLSRGRVTVLLCISEISLIDRDDVYLSIADDLADLLDSYTPMLLEIFEFRRPNI